MFGQDNQRPKAMKESKIKRALWEMVAHIMDTTDLETIDNYTETFFQIHKGGIGAIEKERAKLKKENEKWKEADRVWMKTSLAEIVEENENLQQELQALKKERDELKESLSNCNDVGIEMQGELLEKGKELQALKEVIKTYHKERDAETKQALSTRLELQDLKDAVKKYIDYTENATDEGNEYDPEEDKLFYNLKPLIK